MNKLLAGSGLLLLLLIAPRAASACSCVVPPPPLDALADADAVFAGKVVEVVRVNGTYGDEFLVLFEVSTAWKGVQENTASVRTATNSAACGYDFERGRRYVVYANAHNGSLHTGICSRTARYENATQDLQDLGAGEAIKTADGGLCGGPSPLVALQTFLLVVMGAFLLRLRP